MCACPLACKFTCKYRSVFALADNTRLSMLTSG